VLWQSLRRRASSWCDAGASSVCGAGTTMWGERSLFLHPTLTALMHYAQAAETNGMPAETQRSTDSTAAVGIQRMQQLETAVCASSQEYAPQSCCTRTASMFPFILKCLPVFKCTARALQAAFLCFHPNPRSPR
jgi:hypothetical protein